MMNHRSDKSNSERRKISLRRRKKSEHNGSDTAELILPDVRVNKQEEMLRISEEKYRDMIEYFPAVIVVLNKLGFIISCNSAFKRITGYSKDELIGKHFTKLNAFRLKEIPKYLSMFAEVLKGEVHNPFEIDFIREDGSKGTVEVRVSLLNDGNIQAISTDITERKKTEEALRESENRYKAVIDNAQEGIVVVQDRMLKFVNPLVMTFLGYTEKELMSRPFIEFVHPDDRERVMGIHLLRFKGEEVPLFYEFRIMDEDGNTKWLENNGVLIDWKGGPATLNFLRDITERKITEQELKKHQYYLEKAQDIGKIGTWELDIEKNILVWTDETYQIFGIPKKTVLTYEVFLNCVHPDDMEYVDKKWKAALNKEPYDIEHRIIADGEVKWIREKAELDFDEKGNCVRGIGFAQDITERKEAEEKLLDYQAKLKSLASQLSVVEERERHRIATELHDQIGQSLVFSKIKLEELRKSANSGKLAEPLDEICKNIDQIIQDTRSLTFDLSYPILYELGFEAAVGEWLDEHIGKNYDIKTEFEDDGQIKLLDNDIKALLFRNVRELLTNVVKHAKAHKVKVFIRKVDSQIHVTIEDNGVGLKSAEVTSLVSGNNGFGIFSIRERLEQLGGRLEIESKEWRGSKITMAAPLKLSMPESDGQGS